MEKGMVRCDVNVSVRPKGEQTLGAKIEIKNMNSFSGVRRALEYEIPRQIETLKQGGKLSQETRRWDDIGCITEVMRTKEQAHDYRYFPEPDLMPFEPTEAWLAEVRQRVVELPYARKQRFMRDYQLPATDAQTFVWDVQLGHFFEKALVGAKNPKAVANWIINNLRAKLTETSTALSDTQVKPADIQELVALVDGGKISSSIAQTVFRNVRHRRISCQDCGGQGTRPGQRHWSHRKILRRGHRRQSQTRRGLQKRKGRRAELAQGPGHEIEQRQGKPRPRRRNSGKEVERVTLELLHLIR
jgi:aspartyl-tRNA(Asn)/glutamyl-tRNA(Gln) amidotransferase subunit B